ncbi:MAG: T9SS type A sorting domain-containing protein [Saprospiraceae bacterium]|nr:T9SS type A sorting domain-containing protein [Saprospiraceae bacterium]
MKTFFTLCILIFCIHFKLHSQCTPPMAEICEDANVLCSLDDLNGYACNNPSTIPSPCSPLCSQGGVGHNTSWWGFVTQGGNVTITLTIGGCTTTQGLQYGIWGNCSCSEDVFCRSIPCVPPGSVEVIEVNLIACKTYYLWVDGCSGDICDFTLSTGGGGTPTLSPLGFINDDSDGVIDSVCIGACNYKFFIDTLSACQPTYQWTLDGDEFGSNSNEIFLDFPDVGNFVLCVTAYIGNPQSGSICSQEGPRCATVKVRPLADRMGPPRVICYEQANPGGFKWHSQRVFSSGTYHQEFTDANCCKFDSIIHYTVLNKVLPADVYHITCDNEPYIDLTGRAWVGCKNQFEIPLPKTTDIYQCDSSILLTSVSVNYNAQISANVVNDTLIYSPNVKISNPCNVGEVYEFEYNWRLKADSTKTILSKDEHFKAFVPGDYIVDVFVKCLLGADSAVCTRSFEENFEELKFLNGPLIIAQREICPADTNWLTALVQPLQPSTVFVWEISGGNILSKPDSSSVQIVWNLNIGDTGLVKVHYAINGQESNPSRVYVHTISPLSAGKDFTVYGKSTRLNGKSALTGRWNLIGGSLSAIIDEQTNVRSFVTAEAYGVYCFEWLAQLANCEERDTICVKFKELATYDDKEERQEERGDSLFKKLILRRDIVAETEIRISKMTKEFIELEIHPQAKTIIKYEWLDLSGKLVKSGEGFGLNGQSKLQLEGPNTAGVYFLKVNIGIEVFILKLIIPM